MTTPHLPHFFTPYAPLTNPLRCTGDDIGEARLDLGASTMSRHVVFFNNLEKDEMYRRFGNSIAEILSTYPGR